MDLNGVTLGVIIGGVVAIDKAITYIYRKFNSAYKIKKETEDFILLVHTQQKTIDDFNMKTDLLIEGMKEILKCQLKERHKEYMDRKSITSEELDNFNHLYTVYNSLGGNGTGTKYHNEVLTLPILD